MNQTKKNVSLLKYSKRKNNTTFNLDNFSEPNRVRSCFFKTNKNPLKSMNNKKDRNENTDIESEIPNKLRKESYSSQINNSVNKLIQNESKQKLNSYQDANIFSSNNSGLQNANSVLNCKKSVLSGSIEKEKISRKESIKFKSDHKHSSSINNLQNIAIAKDLNKAYLNNLHINSSSGNNLRKYTNNKNNYLNSNVDNKKPTILKESVKEENTSKKNEIQLSNLNIGSDPQTVEFNFRKFRKTSLNKFNEKITKGPPNCFRWISWMVLLEIPVERDISLLDNYFYSNIDSEIEIQIKKDLSRTLPINSRQVLSIKEINENEYYLYRVLKAFAANDKEASYCQGMNYLASFLLQISNYNEVETFYMLISFFSNTFSDKIGARGFYTQGFTMLNFYVYVFHNQFGLKLPKLYKHLIVDLELSDDAWISKWFMTCFTMYFPIEVVARIWDCLLVVGLEFMISFVIALLEDLENKLLKFNDQFDVVDFFKTLSPFECNYSEKLLEEIEETTPKKLSVNYYDNLSTNLLNVSNTTQNKNQLERINIESIIQIALKNKISKQILESLKRKFENDNNVTLVTKKYELYNQSNQISQLENNLLEYEKPRSNTKNNNEYKLNKILDNEFEIGNDNFEDVSNNKKQLKRFSNTIKKSPIKQVSNNLSQSKNYKNEEIKENRVEANYLIPNKLKSQYFNDELSDRTKKLTPKENLNFKFEVKDSPSLKKLATNKSSNMSINYNIPTEKFTNVKTISGMNDQFDSDMNDILFENISIDNKISGLGLTYSNMNKSLKSESNNALFSLGDLGDDDHVENELEDDCIESKIEMYKFNFTNKLIIQKTSENKENNKK